MLKRLAIIFVTASVVIVPASAAEAGFFTDVAKGAVKNSVRHTKKTIKDGVDLGRLVGSCAINRAKGRPC